MGDVWTWNKDACAQRAMDEARSPATTWGDCQTQAGRAQGPAWAELGGGKPGAQDTNSKETLSPGSVQVQGWHPSVSP